MTPTITLTEIIKQDIHSKYRVMYGNGMCFLDVKKEAFLSAAKDLPNGMDVLFTYDNGRVSPSGEKIFQLWNGTPITINS